MTHQILPNSPVTKAVKQTSPQSRSRTYLTFRCYCTDVRVIADDAGMLYVSLDDIMAARDHLRDEGEGGASLRHTLFDLGCEDANDDGFPKFVSEVEMIAAFDHDTDAAGRAFLSWYNTHVRELRTWAHAMHPETLTPEQESALIDRAMQIMKARIESKR